MISVVCVYNNAEVLERRLLSSLSSQTADYEIVRVDNTDSTFKNAAAALNHGARQAKGDWILFAHQDVSFLSPEWLISAESMLRQHEPSGWVGVAGRTSKGKVRGFMRDRAALLGHPFDNLVEVQTLDECLLIHRREPEGYSYFDEGVPGWHAYGVEACCAAARGGKKNYVLPLPIWHDSKSINLDGLTDAYSYVWQKHGCALRRIYTCCGVLPDSYGSIQKSNSPTVYDRSLYLTRSAMRRIYGLDSTSSGWFEGSLESLTGNVSVVECLHASADYNCMDAEAFIPQPERRRRIIHHFSGLDFKGIQSDCVVVAPDLTAEVLDKTITVDNFAKEIRKLLICLNINEIWMKPGAWRSLLNRSVKSMLTNQWDGTEIVILELGQV